MGTITTIILAGLCVLAVREDKKRLKKNKINEV